MAKVYQLAVNATVNGTQANFDKYAHSLLFADAIQPMFTRAEVDVNTPALIVTSGVDSVATNNDYYQLLADDSRSEVSVNISSGKFVEGNLITVWCTESEAQSDLRNYMTFYANTGDIHLHIGVCNTTQSQDYTPDIIANSRAVKMVTPAQVKNLGL